MKPVLLVEDSMDDVVIMRYAWKKAGIQHPLQVVDDGQKAVDYLSGAGEFADRARYPLPSLVLLDLKLPYRNGIEIAAWIRANDLCRTLPVIFLTSSHSEMDIHRAYSSGSNAYLVKPPTPEKLIEMLTDIKAFWLVHNRFPPDQAFLRVPPEKPLV